MKLTIMLKMHNEAELDARIAALYDRSSPTFRQWLTSQDLSRYAPTQAEVNTVRQQLEAYGFQTISVDPDRFSLRVSGTAATIQSAFHTTLHTFKHKGSNVVAHVTDAVPAGTMAPLIGSVVGIDRYDMKPQLVIARNPITNAPLFQKTLTPALAQDITSQITNIALGATTTIVTNPTPPNVTLTGLLYDPSGLTVSFTPQQLQSYYNMNELYSLGYDGRGQTVAVIDAYGYDAAMTDLNTFSTIFNLPQVTSATFKEIFPQGKPTVANIADIEGWTPEIALDIEYAHTLAPKAKIVVVASNGADNEDIIGAINYVIQHNVSKTVSGSFEADTDFASGPGERAAFDAALKVGAAKGFAFQFSSGDQGDNGVGNPNGAPGIPSESPYATGVGGTSILNNPTGPGYTTTGWGLSDVVPYLFQVFPPPSPTGLIYGAGGGISLYEPKPAWQKSLSGTTRHVPDISALADPQTGVVVVYTDGGTQNVTAGVGGTSLASPLVTAMWAVASQYAGKTLGQIAPVAAMLKPGLGEINDIVPVTPLSASDVTEVFTAADGTQTSVTPAQMFAGSDHGAAGFVSAINNLFPGLETTIYGFGVDGSLLVQPGWDDVTGYGEPNGLPFIAAVAR